PPLVGFFAKQQVLFSTIYSGFYFLSFIAILVSVVSASYYLKIIRVLCFSSYDSNYASITYKNLNILNKELEESHSIEKVFLNQRYFYNLMLTFYVFLIFVPVLVLILLLLNIFLSPHEPITEKVDAYECGFYPVGEQTRHPFIINYFLICLIFLVFEAEVLMFLPSIPTLIYVGSYGIIVAI
ncbi:hypothetical protein CALVIDRAFT_456973, partial [Calocera viscosa TUFC12733]